MTGDSSETSTTLETFSSPGGGPEVQDEVDLKRAAAERAVEMVEPGMRVGLGTGTTAALAIEALARRLREGRLSNVLGVPTSTRTRALARDLGVPLATLEEVPRLDLTIDGADEVDPRLDLLKGGGGALLWEKIVACATATNVIVVHGAKLVARLGATRPLPVEVARFGWSTHLAALEGLGARAELRRLATGEAYVTDGGHYLVECRFPEGIEDPIRLERELRARPGIVEVGLFLGLADRVVVASPAGIEVRLRPEPRPGPGAAPRGAASYH